MPGPNPPPTPVPNTNPTNPTSTTSSSSMSVGSIVGLIFGILAVAVYHGGAAKMSYDRYGSIGWAILAFIFAPLYYPVYGYFISTKSTGLMSAGRRMKW